MEERACGNSKGQLKMRWSFLGRSRKNVEFPCESWFYGFGISKALGKALLNSGVAS